MKKVLIVIALAFAATWLLDAQTRPLPKPSAAMSKAYQRWAVLNDIVQEKRMALSAMEAELKDAGIAAQAVFASECPGCGYDPSKNEYTAPPEKK